MFGVSRAGGVGKDGVLSPLCHLFLVLLLLEDALCVAFSIMALLVSRSSRLSPLLVRHSAVSLSLFCSH